MARILLIDDDALLRDVVRKYLSLAGHKVAIAIDGREAVQSFESGQFDLVITDILMPEMDGLEVILRLRKKQSDIPILALSGGGRTRNMDVLHHAESFGASALLAKPFMPAELLAIVDKLVRA